ncbi:MAG: four helix bundle protein [bacterium]
MTLSVFFVKKNTAYVYNKSKKDNCKNGLTNSNLSVKFTLAFPSTEIAWIYVIINKKLKLKSQNLKGMRKSSWSEAGVDPKQRCYRFSLQIIKLYSKSIIYKTLYNQLLRSATSIGANIVEGKSSSSRKEFRQYYVMALKSANETRYWLGLLRDGKITDSERINKLLDEAIQISKIIASSVIKLKQ